MAVLTPAGYLAWPVLIAAAIITVLSSARLTRLIVNDHWPPILWAKSKWDNRMAESGWWVLFSCPWCFGPWSTLAVLGWAVVDWLIDGQLDWPWWAFNGWLALSYLASLVVFHDEDGSADGSD